MIQIDRAHTWRNIQPGPQPSPSRGAIALAGRGFSKRLRRDSFAERSQAAGVFRRGADRDADKLRQVIAGHRASDHTLLLQLLEYPLPIADFDGEEVGRGRNVGEA